ncbi:tRNA epoxyqueuosine(34) reductase QueG [uncultured Bacteroides sp.]|uniref:tRNA epoxyqueuosine(34) reductase QueG n=1 Tax=uncultured Bacteroides sp. TaxID=162156 RepID=UPI002AA748C7|nr:tRNA epoxyqueuosine(34) reductase QueG [uncultured Bacteroides sp.]
MEDKKRVHISTSFGEAVASTQIEYTNQIKAEALRLGFSACGIAPAEPISSEAEQHFKEWLSVGYQGEMAYMENNVEKRCDPRLLVEGTRSIVSVALNYYPLQQLHKDQYQFAWYAYGKDYHDVMREKMNTLFAYVNEQIIPVKGRVFCDTAPVFDRYWAWRAGLGWIGKNTQLIIPHAGSTFFLGELFLDIDLAYDSPQRNRCGNCNRCQQACPTQAFEAPYKLNANKCISYLTIENRSEIPAQHASKMNGRIYGCDECQRVCPWTRFATPCNTPELQPHQDFMQMTKEAWHALTEEQYRTLFKGSAVKRAKYFGLRRNIEAAESFD